MNNSHLIQFSSDISVSPYFNQKYLLAIFPNISNLYGLFIENELQQIMFVNPTQYGVLSHASHIWQWPFLNDQINILLDSILAAYHESDIIAGYSRSLSKREVQHNVHNIRTYLDPRKWFVINTQSWLCTSKSISNSLRSFHTSGGFIRRATPSDVPAMFSIYNDMAIANSFTRNYMLGNEVFEGMLGDSNFHIYVSCDKCNEIQGFAAFAEHRNHFDYSIAATTRKLIGASASLLHYFILDMKARHDLRDIYLGSGITPNDGLSKFKQRFSNSYLSLYHHQIIADPKSYALYIRNSNPSQHSIDHFPYVNSY